LNPHSVLFDQVIYDSRKVVCVQALHGDVNMSLWKYRAQYMPTRSALIIIKLFGNGRTRVGKCAQRHRVTDIVDTEWLQ